MGQGLGAWLDIWVIFNLLQLFLLYFYNLYTRSECQPILTADLADRLISSEGDAQAGPVGGPGGAVWRSPLDWGQLG